MSDSYTTKCDVCGHVVKPNYRHCPKCEGDRNRRSVDVLREVIVEMKESPPRNAAEERDAIKRLYQLDHPFPEDFIKAITTGSEPKKKASRRADDY